MDFQVFHKYEAAEQAERDGERAQWVENTIEKLMADKVMREDIISDDWSGNPDMYNDVMMEIVAERIEHGDAPVATEKLMDLVREAVASWAERMAQRHFGY